jgi:hypothetical protein
MATGNGASRNIISDVVHESVLKKSLDVLCQASSDQRERKTPAPFANCSKVVLKQHSLHENTPVIES